jgi:tryptophan 2,3-dioxygenase
MAKTKGRVLKIFDQAIDSLRVLRTMERGPLSKAKAIIQLSSAGERKRLTNAKILESLKKLGLATKEELDELKTRVEKLEVALIKAETRSIRKTRTADTTTQTIP